METKKKMPLWLKILCAVLTAFVGVVAGSFTSCGTKVHVSVPIGNDTLKVDFSRSKSYEYTDSVAPSLLESDRVGADHSSIIDTPIAKGSIERPKWYSNNGVSYYVQRQWFSMAPTGEDYYLLLLKEQSKFPTLWQKKIK